MLVLIMGVSGCGKSTIGKGIAKHFNLLFIEGDAYHPPANIAKMAAGKPLNDRDRQPWLETLGEVLAKVPLYNKNSRAPHGAETTPETRSSKGNGAVLACSALKKSYRDTLRKPLKSDLLIVWLDGSREVLLSRLQARKGHFFPTHLLDNQLQTLEPPHGAIRIDIDQSITDILRQATAALSVA